MKTLVSITCLLIVLGSSVGCSDKAATIPDDVMCMDSMAILIMEAQIIEAAVQKRLLKAAVPDAAGKSYFKQALKRHAVSEEVFRRSFDFYKEHPAYLVRIYDKALEELSKKQALLRKPDSPPAEEKTDRYQQRMSQRE